MRPKPASSLQKTYDDCYLMCSTAVYFEGQVRYYSMLPSTTSPPPPLSLPPLLTRSTTSFPPNTYLPVPIGENSKMKRKP